MSQVFGRRLGDAVICFFLPKPFEWGKTSIPIEGNILGKAATNHQLEYVFPGKCIAGYGGYIFLLGFSAVQGQQCSMVLHMQFLIMFILVLWP